MGAKPAKVAYAVCASVWAFIAGPSLMYTDPVKVMQGAGTQVPGCKKVWGDTEISSDRGVTGIGYRRGTQYGEAGRTSKKTSA